jgi:predicted metal-binding protein
MYKEIIPIINYNVISLCKQPYHNHNKGCPNWNKKIGCPPNTKMFDKIYDMSKPIYVIYNIFNLKEHTNNLKLKYPNWTEYQLKCCLYWQPKARKQLSEEIIKFKKEFPNYTIDKCPEAEGIDLTATMKTININLEWPVENYTYQIAIAGILK